MPGRQKNTYSGEATIRVTQIRSSIATKPKAVGTLRALGLGRIGTSNVLPDRPEIRGMLARVPHLVEVTEAAAGEAPAAKSTSGRKKS